MELIHAVIIEDEDQARSALKQELELNCPNVKIVGEAATVKSGLQIILDKTPDLVFLDIQLSDGSGFEILEQIKKPNFKLIFTTADTKHALKAFQFSAVHYLLKPISGSDLIEALNRIEKTDTKTAFTNIENFIQNRSLSDTNKRIALQTSDGIQLVEVKNIIRCQSEGNYTMFHFVGNKRLLISKTLKDFEEMLAPLGFERIHISHLINLSHLISYQNKGGGDVIMSDKSVIPVAQRKKTQLLDILNKISNT